MNNPAFSLDQEQKERAEPLTQEGFAGLLASGFTQMLAGVKTVAVGVSGGPDSMALCKLLAQWSADNNGPKIHVLSVDHGLRPEGAQEAAQVGEWVKTWPGVSHAALSVAKKEESATPTPPSRIMENAREGRYKAMAAYCKQHGIRHLFLAHHQDDQAETFLFRLSKGSGLDGLAAMAPAQDYSAHLTLLRPLLNVPKAQLVATCAHHGLAYVEDPSNASEKFARSRLRKARAALEEEGLSAKRLAVTAMRLARARQALDQIADMALQDITIEKDTSRIVLNYEILKAWPGEVGLRVLIKAINMLGPESDYGPRMEKMEALFEALMLEPEFRKRTLGGVIVERDDKAVQVVLEKEKEK